MEIKILGSFICGLGAIILVVGYFIARTIRQYDKNFDDLYAKRNEGRSKLDELLGEHKAMCKNHEEA